jgi:hypothetical protein
MSKEIKYKIGEYYLYPSGNWKGCHQKSKALQNIFNMEFRKDY